MQIPIKVAQFLKLINRQALQYAEVVFIAVGTPPDEDGSADLKHVLAAAREIGRVMQKPLVIVDKSTVPVAFPQISRQIMMSTMARWTVMPCRRCV